MTTAKLLLHCPDKPGILAEVTDFITVNKGNIIYLDQYVDHVENIFFMRIEWELKDFLVPQEKIEDYFRTLYGQKYEMDFRLYFSDVKPRMAIFVSKLSHCLFDMLARYTDLTRKRVSCSFRATCLRMQSWLGCSTALPCLERLPA